MALLNLPVLLLIDILDSIEDNKDLYSVRLTCSSFYNLVIPRAVRQYDMRLEELEIDIAYPSLCLLHHFVSTPGYRDHIVNLILYTPREERDNFPACTDLEWSHRFGAQQEDAEMFIVSPEAVGLLADCLRKLSSAQILEDVHLSTMVGDGSLLEAMVLVQFPKCIVIFYVDISQLVNHRLGELARSSSRYAPYICHLNICSEQFNTNGWGIVRRLSIEPIRRELVDNTNGRHVKSYQPQKIQPLRRFRDGVKTVENLRLEGCSNLPRLRFCNGCDGIFVHNIASLIYTHLTTLHLGQLYVSGSRLQKFLSRHTTTLISATF